MYKRQGLLKDNEKAFGLYDLQAILMIDDEQVYKLKKVNMPINVEIDIPDELLDDEIQSFYLIGGIDDEYQEIDFERNENSITFNGYIGNQYTFIYEKKASEVEKPSEDQNKPSEDQNKPNEDDKKPDNPIDDDQNSNPVVDDNKPSENDKKPSVSIDDDSNSIDSDVLGSEIDTVGKNKKTENTKSNNGLLNKVQTGDEYQPLLYALILATSLAVPFVLKKKRKG